MLDSRLSSIIEEKQLDINPLYKVFALVLVMQTGNIENNLFTKIAFTWKTMSKFQKLFVVWAVALALLTLFPPFIFSPKTKEVGFIIERTWGFLFYPPKTSFGREMEIDLKILFVEILFISICFAGIIIATKKLQEKLPEKPPEKPDPLKEDLEEYALKTKNLLVKEHVLDTLTICVRKVNDSEEALISFIERERKNLTAGNLTHRFLLNFKERRSQKFFFEILKSDIVKINLIEEYHGLITAYGRVFPKTKELEEIHEKKIELLELKSQCNKAMLKGRDEVSNWFKSHPDFSKELRKSEREIEKIYAIKEINRYELYNQNEYGYETEMKKLIANFIWNNIFGRGMCPEDLLYY